MELVLGSDDEPEIEINTVLVNGVVVQPDPDLHAGFSLGNLLIGESVLVEFQALVEHPPSLGVLYFDTETTNYQYQPSLGVFVDLTTDSNTVIVGLTLNADHFDGVLSACKALNKTTYCLNASWSPSPSDEVSLYRIYKNGIVVHETSMNGPYVYTACLGSKQEASGYEISTVFSGGLESARTPLNIRYD